jgi:hypothetical protein
MLTSFPAEAGEARTHPSKAQEAETPGTEAGGCDSEEDYRNSSPMNQRFGKQGA